MTDPDGLPPHEAGGRHSAPIDREERAPAHWEKEADAIRMLLADRRRRIFTTDESRRVQEGLDAGVYWALPYYERWIHAAATLLVEKCVLGEAELAAEEARLRAAGLDRVEGEAAGHDDGHDHAHQPDDDAGVEVLSPLRLRGVAVRERLVARGVASREEIRAEIERMDTRGPHLGARVVARAWADAEFAARLGTDASGAVAELGVAAGETRLAALFNASGVHHLVVCTLCSCYPRVLLGRPPAWYRSRAYRGRAVRDPRGVLAEFGTVLPAGTQVCVHDSNAELRYLVVPERPGGTEGWSEARLAALVTRDSMIGVARALGPEG